MRKMTAAIGAATLGASLLLAGCGPSNGSAAKSAAASVTADPTVSAELAQAKLLVKSCFPGTLLQQAHTVHLVFLSSATGKNGPAVVAARNTVFGCLHISDPQDRQAFVNDAGEAALHASPKLTTHDGRVQYVEVTLPRLVLKYGGTAAGMGTSTAQPPVPGTTPNIPGATTAPTATAGSPA